MRHEKTFPGNVIFSESFLADKAIGVDVQSVDNVLRNRGELRESRHELREGYGGLRHD